MSGGRGGAAGSSRRSPKRRRAHPVAVRERKTTDFEAIVELCRVVYPNTEPYSLSELDSQQSAFAEGQLVAVEPDTGRLLGTAMSLILLWDDYDIRDDWRDFTDRGRFTNHDPSGGTLYGAEIMVHPETQGMGVGKALYKARRDLCRRLGLRRIRAGARLRGYHRYAGELTLEEYVRAVVAGELGDPTLSFQLKQGFKVVAVVEDYLSEDPSSRGHAAVIEWLNHQAAKRSDYRHRPRTYLP